MFQLLSFVTRISSKLNSFEENTDEKSLKLSFISIAQPMQQQFHKLVSSECGTLVDEVDINLRFV
jgi:hypothetical protein